MLNNTNNVDLDKNKNETNSSGHISSKFGGNQPDLDPASFHVLTEF